jgi:hypothetical protein
MQRLKRTIATIGLASVATVASAGAIGASPSSAPEHTSHSAMQAKKAKGASTPASELRAGLTALLQEHVYLAGIATGTVLSGGDLDAPAAALDANSVALSEAVGSVYGDDAGAAFLDLWRRHIEFFVAYTTAVATDDTAGAEQAEADLDGYRTDFGAFIESANPNLPKEAVAEELIPHIETLLAAIDAQAAGDPSQYDKLREAASHMPHTAQVLADAIVKQFPKKF